MEHRRDIDGLRGIAVLAVVLFHARVAGFQGGFVGVDVFFVLSGYLIASIIRKDIEAGRFTLTGFYERRVRRILPALFVTFLGTWILAFWLYMPPDFQSYSLSVAAASAFVANILFWHEGGYFARPAEIRPLLHLWSLAVEEQFYLLFPPAMILLFRFRPKVRFLAVGFALLISLGLSVWWTSREPGAAFYLTPARAWELMIGALLALRQLPAVTNRLWNESAAAIGLVMIVWAVFAFSSQTPFPGVSAAVPCLGAALLIYSGAERETVARRILSFTPLVFAGLISYSWYLFHWPLLAFARYYWIEPLPALAPTAIVALAAVAAALSWKYVEQPIRSRRGRIRRPHLFAAAAMASAAFLAIGAAGYGERGFPSRYPGYSHWEYGDPLAEYNTGECFLIGNQRVSDWKGDRCFLSRRGLPTALLWGDSFAAHLAPGIKDNASLIHYDVLQYSLASCAPILGRESASRGGCRVAAEEVLALIAKYHVARVILAANWDLESRYYSRFFAGVSSTIAVLRSLGVSVVVIGQSPEFTFSDSFEVNYRLSARRRSMSNYYSFLSIRSDIISNLKRAVNGTYLIDPMEALCLPRSCPIMADGKPLYADGRHLTILGSGILIRAIAAQIDNDAAPAGSQ